MQSVRNLSQAYARGSLSAGHWHWMPTVSLGSVNATRAKSGGQDEVDIKSYYYPNTEVGIKERNIKSDSPPAEPLQTPYPPFPKGKNPETGEVGGPTGPEPTRFGDWERKGRVTDF